MGEGLGRRPLANVGSIQTKSTATANNEKAFVPNIADDGTASSDRSLMSKGAEIVTFAGC